MKHVLAICAIVKNEHDYLLEWIAYHRVVGVDHFLIYNNSSDDDDGTTDLLNKLHRIRAIELVPWPDQANWRLPGGVHLRPQVPAYYDGVERLRNEAEWIAFVDVDEFILPLQREDLPSTLEFYQQFGGVGANWRMFGTSRETIKKNIPVCQRFTMASLPENIVNQHVKCITRPALIREVGVHRPFLKSGLLVDEHGREITHSSGFRYPVSYDILRINHYYTKSREEWLAKVARGRASHPQKRNENSISDAHFNDERDTLILKFVDATVRGMRALADAAGIVGYPSLNEMNAAGNGEDSSRKTRRRKQTISGSLRRTAIRRATPANDVTQDGQRSLPILDANLIGGFANRMMQYMVARRIAAEIEGCCISNAALPAWGIHHALAPGALGPEIASQRSRHQVDIARIVQVLSTREQLRGTFQPNVQWFSNFPDLDLCRSMFPSNESEYPGFGPEYLVCNLRGGEILDGKQMHRVILPIEFYAELAQTTGLKLVFMGQVEENAYCQAIKQRFPDAIFHSSCGPVADFQTFRNSKNLVVAVSTFSWLAAWLSHADIIVLPLNGLFHPAQEPNIDLLPLADKRYLFYLFPINYAGRVDRFEQAHRALRGTWRTVDKEFLSALRTPRQPKRLESFLSMFDEAFYLQTYQDVAAVVRKGGFGSGREHYVHCGFREDRHGFSFDQFWYSTAYPSAALEVGQGEFADLRHHYVEVGAARGYKPVPNQSK
jgi:hypothetical protein